MTGKKISKAQAFLHQDVMQETRKVIADFQDKTRRKALEEFLEVLEEKNEDGVLGFAITLAKNEINQIKIITIG